MLWSYQLKTGFIQNDVSTHEVIGNEIIFEPSEFLGKHWKGWENSKNKGEKRTGFAIY